MTIKAAVGLIFMCLLAANAYTPPTRTPQINFFSTVGCTVAGGSIGDLFSAIVNVDGHQCNGPNQYTYPDGAFDLYTEVAYTVNLPDYDIVTHVQFYSNANCTKRFSVVGGSIGSDVAMPYNGCTTLPIPTLYGALSYSAVSAAATSMIASHAFAALTSICTLALALNRQT